MVGTHTSWTYNAFIYASLAAIDDSSSMFSDCATIDIIKVLCDWIFCISSVDYDLIGSLQRGHEKLRATQFSIHLWWKICCYVHVSFTIYSLIAKSERHMEHCFWSCKSSTFFSFVLNLLITECVSSLWCLRLNSSSMRPCYSSKLMSLLLMGGFVSYSAVT